jgi:peptidoglycan/xylan/chitin deacetylase (PgdA/CDA1 family)
MIIKNFLFHRVSDETDHLWPPMPVALFNTLVNYITRKYEVIKLEDHVISARPVSYKKQPATILFDDGYKDNIEYAVPILEKFKCPASFYVVTDCIDKNIPTWTYIVDHLLQNTGKKELQIDMDFVPGALRKSTFNNYSEKLAFGSRLKPWMKSLSNDQRRVVMTHLDIAFSDVALPANKMMSWNDLRMMQSGGYTIGSHSMSHPLLATIQDESELSIELNQSGKRIMEELGQFPLAISYPVGSYDERVINISRQAGYKMGLAVKQQFYNTTTDDIFAIPRVELYNESLWKCKLRIKGVYSWVKKRMNT